MNSKLLKTATNMKMTRQLPGLCLVIGMTISGNTSVYSQGPAYARATSFIPPPVNTPIAQNELRALKIGDKVPNIEFTLINYPTQKARLSDFTGKLVILDFWATWCTACIHGFPKLDSLQKEFGDKLQVILINKKSTGDDYVKIERFFEKWKVRHKEFELPSAVMDTVAGVLFSHMLIPHYVLIDPDGKVKAITSSDQINRETIAALLNNKEKAFVPKKDIDATKPLFASSDLPFNESLEYSIFLRGRYSGLGSGAQNRYSDEVIRGRAFYNSEMASIYNFIARNIDSNFSYKRMVFKVKDPSVIKSERIVDATDEWLDKNLFTYEFIVPVKKAHDLYPLMLAGLNASSDYWGHFEKKKIKCLALVKIGKDDKCRTKGGDYMNKMTEGKIKVLNNIPISFLVKLLNDDVPAINLPIVNETNIKYPVDLKLKFDFADMKNFRNELNQAGLDLIEVNRELSVFIIEDKNLTPHSSTK